MVDKYKNGEEFTYDCPLHVNGFWAENQEKVLKALSQSEANMLMLKEVVENTKHLAKLDTLAEIKDGLLSFAVGRDQIPTQIVDTLFAQMHKNFRSTLLATAAVIASLLIVIVFLLTGAHLGWLDIFGKS